ncbi:UDP-glucose 4-epimerase [Paenibacillus turicensis]|uniref:UDP-glucose 4-epimerase n=1 Tax=Paenibacillus turicensis TaxID=160487 RepID=A0ABS4FR82_9BACL|nr:NAD-dependent epimerase/dehydratase family protein [Paenibacillus turicensis]MBP1905093.1 UDP-glucose 4-epimerase [Paenibacillus turicensis]
MKRILVTGGAGFIGSHLVSSLVQLGYEVHVMDNLSTGAARMVHPKAILHVHNIAQFDTIELIKTIQPEIIYHLAAQADVQSSILFPTHDADTNIRGTLHILEYCREHCNTTKVIFASTSAVYGQLQKEYITEHDPTHPISFYGLSKLTAEGYIKMYHDFYNISYTILRFANVYGPGQTAKGEGGVIAIFMERLSKSLPLLIHGDGEQTRDFIYVDDVVQALIAAHERGASQTLHVSTAKKTSINKLATLANNIHQRYGDIVPILHSSTREGDIKHSCLCNTSICKHLNWQVQYPIEKGLELTYATKLNPQ